jgi:hypothetical protein
VTSFLDEFAKKGIVRGIASKTLPVVGEVATENLQEVIEVAGKAAAKDENMLTAVSEMTADQFIDITAKTIFGAGGMSVVQNAAKGKSKIEDIRQFANDPIAREFALEQVQVAETNGDITPQQAETARQVLLTKEAVFNQIKDFVSEENQEQALKVQEDYNNVVEQSKSVSAALKPILDQKKEVLEAKLIELAGYKETEDGRLVKTRKPKAEQNDAVNEAVSEGASEGVTETEVVEEVVREKAPVLLSKDIEVKSSEGRKGIVPIAELEDFIGEDRLGDAQMPTSRARIDKLK